MSGEISLDRLLANYRLAVQIQDRDGSRENHKAVADAHRALHAAWNRRAEPSAEPVGVEWTREPVAISAHYWQALWSSRANEWRVVKACLGWSL